MTPRSFREGQWGRSTEQRRDWNVEGVKAVYFHAEDQPWHEHGVAGVAEKQVSPDATTTYCLRVVKADDSLEVHYMTVTVIP
jgi:hypothetical protein